MKPTTCNTNPHVLLSPEELRAMRGLGLVDLHVHTNNSDGAYSVHEVLTRAKQLGIYHIAITDHNIVRSDCAVLSRGYGLHVIPGCEISTRVQLGDRNKEIHLNAFWIDPNNLNLRRILKENRSISREPYLKAYLSGLASLRIHLTDDGRDDIDLAYQQLLLRHPESKHIGRQALAARMQELGICTSEEAYRRYLGRTRGDDQRVPVRAEDYFPYVPMEKAIRAIHDCPGAIACLNHPLYTLDADRPDQLIELVAKFKELGGDAMEVFYGDYNLFQQTELLQICHAYDLLPSAGSDHHNERTPMKGWGADIYNQLWRLHRRKLRTAE